MGDLEDQVVFADLVQDLQESHDGKFVFKQTSLQCNIIIKNLLRHFLPRPFLEGPESGRSITQFN